MLVPLAGGGQETLLSEIGFVLLPLFTTADACALRLVCREFLAAVTEHPWEDRETVIQGSIAAWRACFPRALCANVRQYAYRGKVRATPVVDADFTHLEALRELRSTLAGRQRGGRGASARGVPITRAREGEASRTLI